MNEPAIRTEEQIISLFPDRETLICRGWVLKKWKDGLWSIRCITNLYRCYQKNQEEKSFKEQED